MIMRDVFIFLLVFFPGLGIVNAFWFGRELADFLVKYDGLRSDQDMLAYKRVVGRQMYAALVQIVLLLMPTLLFFTGFFSGVLKVLDLVFVVVPSVLVIVVGMRYKRLEEPMKAILAATPELENERDDVVATWLKKPFPDW
jgi:hypothetical protein